MWFFPKCSSFFYFFLDFPSHFQHLLYSTPTPWSKIFHFGMMIQFICDADVRDQEMRFTHLDVIFPLTFFFKKKEAKCDKNETYNNL